MDELPKVSVIIPAYNEERYIARCLTSLAKQTYPSYEVIVVDDGSSDSTVRVVQSFAGVRLSRQQHGGPGSARNLGAQEATGDILVFIDADMFVAPDFISKLVSPILEGTAVGTNTKEEFVANIDNPWALCWNIHTGRPIGRVLLPDFPDEWPVFRALPRDLFLSVGGYDTQVGYGEDHTVSAKLGVLAQAALGAVCYHHYPETLGEVFASARWIGKGEHTSKTIATLIRYSPLWSLKNCLGPALRYRNAYFPLFKVVFDFGILVGTAQAMIRPERHWK